MLGPLIRRKAKPTLTAVEMHHRETLEFEKCDGTTVRLELESTGASIVSTTLAKPGVPERAAKTVYRFHADIRVNGISHVLEREVGSQASFYEPWEIAGVRIWLDVVDAIFEFLHEKHGRCRSAENAFDFLPPRPHARFAIQDATLRICPDILHPWCPIRPEGLRIEDCYRGEDCWLGAYDGATTHGGLDINHPAGTPLWAPLDIHDHFYFNSVEMGHNNNRWRGLHRWPDGSEWILQAHHMTALTVPEHTFLPKGTQFALGAGVCSGSVDHSHFVFAIHDRGETILLDPWLLFWQILRDRDHPAA